MRPFGTRIKGRLGGKGGEVMYWDKEFNFKDKDVKHLWEEYAVAVGGFTAVIIMIIIAGALM